MRRQVEVQMILENAAFDDHPDLEVARILKNLAAEIELVGMRHANGNLRDYNGNTVGAFSYWGGDE